VRDCRWLKPKGGIASVGSTIPDPIIRLDLRREFDQGKTRCQNDQPGVRAGITRHNAWGCVSGRNFSSTPVPADSDRHHELFVLPLIQRSALDFASAFSVLLVAWRACLRAYLIWRLVPVTNIRHRTYGKLNRKLAIENDRIWQHGKTYLRSPSSSAFRILSPSTTRGISAAQSSAGCAGCNFRGYRC
jgi:hypothetical protein